MRRLSGVVVNRSAKDSSSLQYYQSIVTNSAQLIWCQTCFVSYKSLTSLCRFFKKAFTLKQHSQEMFGFHQQWLKMTPETAESWTQWKGNIKAMSDGTNRYRRKTQHQTTECQEEATKLLRSKHNRSPQTSPQPVWRWDGHALASIWRRSLLGSLRWGSAQ